MLDTDHLRGLERSDPPGAVRLRARLAHVPPAEVGTTSIRDEEQKRGWMAYRARTRSVAHQATEEALVRGDEVIVGQTSLENMDLHVDCRERHLLPNPAHPDQPVIKIK